MKRFNYLLGQTELFQHFIDIKVRERLVVSPFSSMYPHPFADSGDVADDLQRDRDPEFAAMLAAEQAKKDNKGKKKAK